MGLEEEIRNLKKTVLQMRVTIAVLGAAMLFMAISQIGNYTVTQDYYQSTQEILQSQENVNQSLKEILEQVQSKQRN